MKGIVYLVGAGPGEELLCELIAAAASQGRAAGSQQEGRRPAFG